MTDSIQVKDGRGFYDPYDDEEDTRAEDRGFVYLPETKRLYAYRRYPGTGFGIMDTDRITFWPVGEVDKAQKCEANWPWIWGVGRASWPKDITEPVVSATTCQFIMTKLNLRGLVRTLFKESEPGELIPLTNL